MQDQLSEVLFYVKGTLKYKWAIIIVAWLVCITGWVTIATMPDKYETTAIVSVDSRTMLKPLLRGIAIQSSTRGIIEVMRELMFTRPKLEQVAQFADLDIDSKDELQKLALLDKLKMGINIKGGKNDLFSISYEGDDPHEAQNVVHAVLTVFSEQAQERGIGDTSSAQQFIEEQIREYEVRLKNSEKARENFKRLNSGLLPGEEGGQLSTLSNINQQLQVASMSLSELSSRERVLNSQIDEALEMGGEDEWGFGDIGSQVGTPEDAEIEALTARMNELLIKYTANHPDVLSIKTTIHDLQKSKRERLANMPDSPDVMNSISNPYVQTLKMTLNQIQAEKASIRSRIYVLKTRVKNIQQNMDSRLHIETEMQNLDRDYSVIKANYMELVQRREQASMTQKAGRSQGVLKFKIIETPTVPLGPTAPNRELLNSMVALFGIVAGIAIAFLIYFIRPTFMSTQQVKAVTGLPVLGSVSMQTKTGATPFNMHTSLFWLSVSGLVLAYMLVMASVMGEALPDMLSSL